MTLPDLKIKHVIFICFYSSM